MKTNIILIAMSFFAFTAFAQNKKAIAYNNDLVEYQHKITPASDKLIDALKSRNLETMKKAEKDLIDVIDKSIVKMKAFEPFEGDSKLKGAFIDWAEHYKDLVEKQYSYMSSLLGGKMTNESKKKVDELIALIQKEEHEYDVKLEEAQKAFTEAHKVELK
jgi:hypothetical protein